MDVQAGIGVPRAGDGGKQADLFGDDVGCGQCATNRLLGQRQRVVEESAHPLGRTPAGYVVMHRARRQMTSADLGTAPHPLRNAVVTDVVRVMVSPELDLVVRRRGGLAEANDARARSLRLAPHSASIDWEKPPARPALPQPCGAQ